MVLKTSLEHQQCRPTYFGTMNSQHIYRPQSQFNLKALLVIWTLKLPDFYWINMWLEMHKFVIKLNVEEECLNVTIINSSVERSLHCVQCVLSKGQKEMIKILKIYDLHPRSADSLITNSRQKTCHATPCSSPYSNTQCAVIISYSRAVV